MAPEVVVLSPHLDDAVLSLGALIGREVAAGRRVEVWSCYTAGPPLESIPPERRVFGDYSVRLAEDDRALAVLGAGHQRLDLCERIWREPRLEGTLHVFRTPPRIEDFVELPTIAHAIGELLDGTAVVYAPLAIGHHVDHVEVALAALKVMLARHAYERLRFYEDPYAMGRGCRRQHFLARRRMWPWFSAPAWASPRVGGLLRLVSMSSRGPRIEDYMPEVARLDWTCHPHAVGEVDEVRKLEAVEAYVSQVRAFGGGSRVRAFMHRGHRVLGGEPVWSCRPAASPSIASVDVGGR